MRRQQRLQSVEPLCAGEKIKKGVGIAVLCPTTMISSILRLWRQDSERNRIDR